MNIKVEQVFKVSFQKKVQTGIVVRYLTLLVFSFVIFKDSLNQTSFLPFFPNGQGNKKLLYIVRSKLHYNENYI